LIWLDAGLSKIGETGSLHRQPVSCRPRTAIAVDSVEYIAAVNNQKCVPRWSSNCLFLDFREIADYFIFQQDTAPALSQRKLKHLILILRIHCARPPTVLV